MLQRPLGAVDLFRLADRREAVNHFELTVSRLLGYCVKLTFPFVCIYDARDLFLIALPGGPLSQGYPLDFPRFPRNQSVSFRGFPRLFYYLQPTRCIFRDLQLAGISTDCLAFQPDFQIGYSEE